MLRDVEYVCFSLPDAENRAVFFVYSERIEPDRFGLKFLGVQARVRRIHFKKSFLFFKFLGKAEAGKLFPDAVIERLDPRTRAILLVRAGNGDRSVWFCALRK